MAKKSRLGWWLVVVLVAGWGSGSVWAKSAGELLQEGTYAEEIEGNLDKAIQIFDEVIAADSSGRSYVAQAMFRKGMCFMKKQDETLARATFEKLVVDFADQSAVIDKAKAILDDLTITDPASLMPADTIWYLEIGTPGKQIETILTMLKGTPIENPLAAIQGGKPGDGPAIISALFNPSMMAEFKKIRGMAVGMTDIPKGTPRMVAVLYPGQSDALRGIITMALGMAGKPGEAVEGLQTTRMGDSMGAAYDDKVIIVGHPWDLVVQAARRYTGKANEPSLATNKDFFGRVNKKARQDNALTLWINADAVYPKVQEVMTKAGMTKGQLPNGMEAVNAFLDLPNLDQVMATVSLKPSGFTADLSVDLKPGHQCVVYNLFRTPGLSPKALATVPADAMVLFSAALSDPSDQTVDAIRGPIRALTGLDIGREIFANLQQVNVFVLPGSGQSPLGPGAGLCLVVTSKDPARTAGLIRQVLATASAATGQTALATTDIPAGMEAFALPIGGKEPMAAYLGQTGKVTVLGLTADTAKACMEAARSGKAKSPGGAIQTRIAGIGPQVNKLALAHLGGLIRTVLPFMARQVQDKDRQAFDQATSDLAKAADCTTFEVWTSEQDLRLSVHAELAGLPPLSQVFGSVSQIVKVMQQARPSSGRAAGPGKQAVVRPPAGIAITQAAPAIDGRVEDLWAKTRSYRLRNVVQGPGDVTDEDCSATFKAMYDANALYVLVDVKDDQLVHDSTDPFWLDDSIEVFIDADNDLTEAYGPDDYQFYVPWDRSGARLGELKRNKTSAGQAALTTKDNGKGYVVELRFAWSELGIRPTPGRRFGLDVHVNDDDDGQDRDHKRTWWGTEDTASSTPQAFGAAEILGMVGWWKFDESAGTQALDSSSAGNHGTLHGGATWQPTAGKINGALSLDGKDGYVDLPADLSRFGSGMTVTVWAKPTGAQFWGRFLETGRKGKGHADAIALGRMQDTGDLCFEVYRGTEHRIVIAPQAIEPNQWQFFAATVDTKGQARLYKNSEPVKEETLVAIPPAEREYTYIGKSSPDWPKNQPYQGLMDEFRIYNYALSAEEIRQIQGQQH